MLSHDYINNDVDVKDLAAPEFAKEAVKQLVKERWAKIAPEKLSLPKAVKSG